MKRRESKWKDPVKGISPRKETLDAPGDFGEFTATMRRIISKRPEPEASKPSASRVPDAS